MHEGQRKKSGSQRQKWMIFCRDIVQILESNDLFLIEEINRKYQN